MTSSKSSTAISDSLWQRAWIFSLVFHLLSCGVLAISINRYHGGAIAPAFSSGIVLQLAEEPEPPVDARETTVASIVAVPPSPATPIATSVVDPPTEKTAVTAVASPQVATALTSDIRAAQDAFARQESIAGASRSGQGLKSGMLSGASQARVSVFGVTGVGTKFVYLFDRSASMEGAPLAAAKRQLLQSLESLEGIHQFQIIFFNTLPYPIDITGNGRMAFATDQNKRLAQNVVNGVTADMGTDRYPALKRAISFKPDVIFFLTDAEDEMSASDLADIERANGRVGATICVIEFGRPAGPKRENFLMRLARGSGGQYGYVSTTGLGQ